MSGNKTENPDPNRLYRLKDLKNFEIAKHNPDVRGWDVLSADGRDIGKVDELIVDTQAMKVRYLDIYVYEEISGVDEHRHLLIPVGIASLDEKHDKVRLNTIETMTLLKFPEYEGGNISREYENSLRQNLSPDTQTLVKPASDYYDNDIFDENKFYGSRRKYLYRLSELDNRSDFADKDIKGYFVVDSNGNELGRVEDVVVEPEQKRIRYFEISVDDSIRPYNYTGNTLIPIGLAGMSDKEKHIMINLDRETFLKLPTFQGTTITRDYENMIRDAIRIESGSNTQNKPDDYYNNQNYDENRFFDVRRQRGMM